MSSTRYSVHGVVSIAVKYEQPTDQTGWLAFTFKDKDGGVHDLTAFVDGPVAIDGAEFINFMAVVSAMHAKQETPA